LKQQGDGAGETSRTTNYELHGTGEATRAPVAQTLHSVRQPNFQITNGQPCNNSFNRQSNK
jgi:hypothetical protein